MAAPHLLAARFAAFAERDCPDDPLYVALCGLVAAQPDLAALLAAAPAVQQRPNLWLAAVQDRLLERGPRDALAAYYPSLGGTRLPDADLPAALAAFVAAEGEALRERIATRSTQTNEVGRCAVLHPLLLDVARRHPGRPLALLDFGTSAGLNLGVDRYRYDHGGRMGGAAAGPGVPVIRCEPVGPGLAPVDGPLPLVARLGIDPDPVDVNDAQAVRWLQACLWPHDRERASRFVQAVALARHHRWPVRRQSDCTAAVAPWLDTLPAGCVPVLFNSWVLTYLPPAALRAHVAHVRTLVAERGLVWLSGEADAVDVGPVAPAPPPLRPGDTAWTLVHRVGGEVRTERAAWSHPHGRHLEWRGPR